MTLLDKLILLVHRIALFLAAKFEAHAERWQQFQEKAMGLDRGAESFNPSSLIPSIGDFVEERILGRFAKSLFCPKTQNVFSLKCYFRMGRFRRCL